MKEHYIKDKVTYLTESSEAIARIRKQCQAARIANQLHSWMEREHQRVERDFARYAHMVVSQELV